MLTPRHVTGLVGAVLSALLVFSSVAFGSVAVDGNDYSQDLSGRTVMKVCDGENDGHSAYTNYILDDNAVFRMEDFTGPGDKCPIRGPIYPKVNRHRVCENIYLWPDECSQYIRANS
jgi:hypothetical protein